MAVEVMYREKTAIDCQLQCFERLLLVVQLGMDVGGVEQTPRITRVSLQRKASLLERPRLVSQARVNKAEPDSFALIPDPGQPTLEDRRTLPPDPFRQRCFTKFLQDIPGEGNT